MLPVSEASCEQRKAAERQSLNKQKSEQVLRGNPGSAAEKIFKTITAEKAMLTHFGLTVFQPEKRSTNDNSLLLRVGFPDLNKSLAATVEVLVYW